METATVTTLLGHGCGRADQMLQHVKALYRGSVCLQKAMVYNGYRCWHPHAYAAKGYSNLQIPIAVKDALSLGAHVQERYEVWNSHYCGVCEVYFKEERRSAKRFNE